MNSKWRLTYPATLYVLLTAVVVVLSWILEIYGVEAVVPSTGEVVKVQSPFTPEGVRWFLRNAVSNYTGFSPLGSVIVFLFGLGVSLHSGFIESCLRSLMPQSGRHVNYATATIIILGLMSNVVGDAGYVVLLPLAAATYSMAGLNPLAGLMTAHVASACGFSANVMISTLDTLMSRITDEATTATLHTSGSVGTMSSYIFMSVSTILLFFVIYASTRCRKGTTTLLQGNNSVVKGVTETSSTASVYRKPLSHRERRSLYVSLLVGILYAILVLVTTFSSFGILRDASGGLQRSPFMIGILYIVAIGFGLTGITYGFMSGRFRSDRDLVAALLHFAKPICSYLVITLFASQMFALISYSNIDRVLTASSAEAFAQLSLSPTAMLLALIVYTALLNLVTASASAKWSTMAYVILPAMAAVGITTEASVCAFRIGDSVTNAVTPLMPYVPMLFALMLHYKPDATYVTMLRYIWRPSLYVTLCWIFLFFLWYLIHLPIGI
jgi:aminobenzoyl-glutamate transport protein